MDFFVPFFKYPIVREFTRIKSWRVIDPPEAIRTGDLLLFSASGFLSSTIKLFSASRWNHVGMAVWCELTDYQNRTTIDLFCFEAGSQPFTDLMTRKYVDQGVRLVRFSDIAGMYDLVYHRGLTVHRDKTWARRFQEFMFRWKGVPFMRSYVTLARSFLLKPCTVKREVTCSMLTAHMFDEMGVHPINFNPSQISPSDYLSRAKAFPQSVFTGPEKLIWTDNRWINARLVFSIIILVTLIIIVIMLVIEVMKKINSNKIRKLSKSSSVS
jgi:hypothetical protein